MAVKFAEAHLQLTPRLGGKAVRTRAAEARLKLRIEAPISSSALGGDAVTLTIKGSHAEELIKLLAMLKTGQGNPSEIMDVLREMARDSDTASDVGGSEGAAA